MAVLRMIEGDWPNRVFRLDGDQTVIGKAASCDIILPDKHVSKVHAKIVRRADGRYIEDLDSTNHTRVGGVAVEGPRLLMDGDVIKICKYRFKYAEGVTAADETPRVGLTGDSNPTILQTIDVLKAVGPSKFGANAEEKLRGVIEIGAQLVGILDVAGVMEKVLDALFRIFPQAYRGFIVFRDERTDQLAVRARKLRHPEEGQSAPSRTVYDLVTREGRAILCEDVGEDSRFDESRSLEMYQVRTMICVPLWDHQRRAVGVLQVDTREGKSRFTQGDLDFLVALANTISMAVENATLHERDVLEGRRLQEARDARVVQAALIPDRYPDLPGYEFWHHYEPAHFVGGDYFDYRPVPGPDGSATAGSATRWAIALGDVSGKGMPAALVMARFSAEVRLLVQAEPDPVRLVSRLNRSLCENNAAERFVTFLLAIVDGERHELTVVNAGHSALLIRRDGGRLEPIGDHSTALPLGVQDNETFSAVTTALDPGDVVVLFTDGVDAMGLDGQLFGAERLNRAIVKATPGVASVGEAIRDAVERYSEGRPQFDDITILCFGRKRPVSPAHPA
jgi:phosphoserine phosphatase RsbU/P